MKKFNVTYEQIASYSNIYAAYLDARKGKSERNEIMRFSLELDAHLNDLYNDLQEERYKVILIARPCCKLSQNANTI